MLKFMCLTWQRKAKNSAWQNKYENRINDKFGVKIVFFLFLFAEKNDRDFFFIVCLHFQPALVIPTKFISVFSMETME